MPKSPNVKKNEDQSQYESKRYFDFQRCFLPEMDFLKYNTHLAIPGHILSILTKAYLEGNKLVH